MFKRINGTWLELHHFGLPEGKYFNPICHEFDDEQWQEKIREIASLNMKYIVVMATSYTDMEIAESYFDSGIYPFSKMIAAKNPLEAILSECDKLGMKVFLSVGLYGPWMTVYENMTSEEVFKKSFKGMNRLYELFSHHSSFYGWYFPDETGIQDYFEEEYITYVNRYSAHSKSLNPNLKTLIAPYGTCKVKTDEKFVDQLKRLDVDFVAYQDEVGVKKATPEQTKTYYANLKKAHDLANRSHLWADVELFDFEGDVYKSALLPATVERLEKQLESVSPYVEEVLVFEYQGMMNKPGTRAFCGHPDSIQYYKDYQELLKKRNIK